jgi:hypothetical protein
MPQVTDVKDVILVDPVLTQVAIGYRVQGAVAENLLPTLPVSSVSGQIARFGKDAFRRESARRGRGSQARRVHWSVESVKFFCEEYALEIAVDDRDVAASQNPIDPFVAATTQLVDMLTLDAEVRARDAVVNALTTAGYSTTPTTKWDQSGSTPITDLKNVIVAVSQRIGVRPTTVVISRPVWEVLIEHSQVADRLKFTNATFSTEILARWLEVREVVIGDMVMDTAVEGATPNLQYVWGDRVVIAFVPQRPAINQPAFGYRPTLSNFVVERYRDEPSRSTVIRVRHEVAEVVTAPDAGHLLNDVLASI